MAKKPGIPEKYQIWIEVRKRYHLSDTQVQMARELGLIRINSGNWQMKTKNHGKSHYRSLLKRSISSALDGNSQMSFEVLRRSLRIN